MVPRESIDTLRTIESPVRRTSAMSPAIICASLLDQLLKSTSPLTVESLARGLGLTVSDLHHELDRLESAGCQIQRHPQNGVKLLRSGLGTWVDYLHWVDDIDLSGVTRDKRVIEVYQRTSSTQDAARRLILAYGRSAHDAVVIAHEQTAGRGRLGRTWLAPAGSGVTFSVVRYIAHPSQDSSSHNQAVNQLTLATAVAVADVIAAVIHPDAVQIKWPNDILVDGKKIAGILVETFEIPQAVAAEKRLTNGLQPISRVAVIGIGINVALTSQQIPDPELQPRVTSLAMFGHSVDELTIISGVIRELRRIWDEADLNSLLVRWRQHWQWPIGGRGRFMHDGTIIEGQILDLDPQQGLIVSTHDGLIVHLPATATTVMDESSTAHV